MMNEKKTHPRRMRVTETGRVLEQLTMFEIIEEAEKYWKPAYEEGKFEFGKAVVLFPCIEFNEVSYVMANFMPQPMLIKFNKGWKKAYKEFKEFIEEQGLYVIETNDNGHRKVSPEVEKEVMQEVKKRMKMNSFN